MQEKSRSLDRLGGVHAEDDRRLCSKGLQGARRAENPRLTFAAFAADFEGSAPVGLFVRRRDRPRRVHAHDCLDDDALFRAASGAFGDWRPLFSALAGRFLFSSGFGGHGRTLHQIAGREKSPYVANNNTRDRQHTSVSADSGSFPMHEPASKNHAYFLALAAAGLLVLATVTEAPLPDCR